MKEKLKSITLFILFVLALVLTYLNTAEPFFVSNKDDVSLERPVSLKSVMTASAICYSFGNGDYTRIYKHEIYYPIWSEAYDALDGISVTNDRLKPISKKNFFDNFSKKSFLIQLYGIYDDVDLGSESLFGFDDILITEREIFIRKHDLYYKIKDEDVSDLYTSMVQHINHKKYVSYRKVSDRFSLREILGKDEAFLNYSLIPYTYDASVAKASAMYEFDYKDRAEINAIAKGVLGERLDFTQSFIDSSDSVVLMSDRGTRSLTFANDGKIIYRTKISEQAGAAFSFEHALMKALDAIKLVHGIPEGLFLKGCYKIEDNKYQLEFGYTFGGGQYLVTGEDVGIRVVVQGEQVLEVHRKIIKPKLTKVPDSTTFRSIDRCISDNFPVFDVDFESYKGNEIFYVYSLIEDVSMVFLYGDNQLSPTWNIVVDGKVYYFDAVEGWYLGGNDELEKN